MEQFKAKYHRADNSPKIHNLDIVGSDRGGHLTYSVRVNPYSLMEFESSCVLVPAWQSAHPYPYGEGTEADNFHIPSWWGVTLDDLEFLYSRNMLHNYVLERVIIVEDYPDYIKLRSNHPLPTDYCTVVNSVAVLHEVWGYKIMVKEDLEDNIRSVWIDNEGHYVYGDTGPHIKLSRPSLELVSGYFESEHGTMEVSAHSYPGDSHIFQASGYESSLVLGPEFYTDNMQISPISVNRFYPVITEPAF